MKWKGSSNERSDVGLRGSTHLSTALKCCDENIRRSASLSDCRDAEAPRAGADRARRNPPTSTVARLENVPARLARENEITSTDGLAIPANQSEETRVKTITVQIGNSDDKLLQSVWSAFVTSVDLSIKRHCSEIHFSGAPSTAAPWQNYCWVFACSAAQSISLMSDLKHIRESYGQASAAWTEGDTKFI